MRGCDTFYGRTPWHLTAEDGEGFVLSGADEGAARVFCDEQPCAVVMGARGETYGLALYDSHEHAQAAADWSRSASMPPATTVTFDPAALLNRQDLETLHALSCELPGREALPLVFRIEARDNMPVCPSPKQLERLEAALNLVPDAREHEALGGSAETRLGGGEIVRVRLQRVPLYSEGVDPPSVSELVVCSGGAELAYPEEFEEIAGHLGRFFSERPHLGTVDLYLNAAILLCSQEDSPVVSGNPRSWAAGVAHSCLRLQGAIGREILAADLAAGFGVSKGTATQKAKEVDKVLAALAKIAGAI